MFVVNLFQFAVKTGATYFIDIPGDILDGIALIGILNNAFSLPTLVYTA